MVRTRSQPLESSKTSTRADLLNTPSLFGVRKLILAESRRNNIDLAPLVGYVRVELP